MNSFLVWFILRILVLSVCGCLIVAIAVVIRANSISNNIFRKAEYELKRKFSDRWNETFYETTATDRAVAMKNYENEMKRYEIKKEKYDQWETSLKPFKDDIEYFSNAVDENNIIISSKDKSLNTIEFVIAQIETGRADSVKEALNQYDAKLRHDNVVQEQRIQYEIDRRDQMMRDDANKKAIEDAAFRQRIHNDRMEELRKKELEEIEKINRNLNR